VNQEKIPNVSHYFLQRSILYRLVTLQALMLCLFLNLAAGQVRRKDPAPNIGRTEGIRPTNLTAMLQTWDALNYKYPANTTYWPCGMSTKGLGAAPINEGEVVAGYDHRFDAGTDPLPCKEQINHVYEGLVWFDLGSVIGKAVVSHAELSMKLGESRVRDKEWKGSNPRGPCWGIELTLATADPKGLKPNTLVPGDVFTNLFGTGFDSGCGLGGCTIDVTYAVNEWLRAHMPNHGFALKYHKDSQVWADQDNAACWTRYSDFSLRLTYAP
jgi:hypothetical protein